MPYLKLHGSITNAKGSYWSGGLGYFDPNIKSLDLVYYFAGSELAAGKSTIYLTTTGTGYCKAETDTMNITIFPLPVAKTGANDSICPGDTILISGSARNGTPPYKFLWTPGGYMDSSVYVSQNFSTSYKFKVIDVNGCKATDQITVYVNPSPKFKLFFPDCLIPGDVALIKVLADSLSNNFWWQDGVNNNEYKVLAPGIYKLAVENIYGCRKYDTIYLKYCTFIWVPKSFSPNGDGINDFFIVNGLEIYNYHINIFNRWGKLIFQSDDIGISWDGMLDDIPCQEGVYGWTINYNNGNMKKIKRGYLTLIR